MAYMSKQERQDKTEDIHQTYALRKFLIFLDIILLIGFIVLTFVSTYLSDVVGLTEWSFWKGDDQWKHIQDLSVFGIIMLIYAIVIALLSIWVIVLTFGMHSPKKTTQTVLELEATPIAGRKKAESKSASQINEERLEVKKTKKR
ncbi:MAG: hypothetical protein ACOQNY_00470 [Mycoplasmoidaceae bacterium]